MRIILLCMILSLKGNTFDVDTASKIFNKIFTAVFPFQIVKVYSPNPKYDEVIQQGDKLQLVNSVKQSNISLITSLKELHSVEHKLIFTTNLPVLRKSENAIGAFYWEYGRPKIIFIEPRLTQHHIHLPKSFQKYIIKDIP